MPLLILVLVLVGAAFLGYALVINSAASALGRGVEAEATSLRLLPRPVRRHAHLRLLPGTPLPPDLVDDPAVEEAPEAEWLDEGQAVPAAGYSEFAPYAEAPPMDTAYADADAGATAWPDAAPSSPPYGPPGDPSVPPASWVPPPPAPPMRGWGAPAPPPGQPASGAIRPTRRRGQPGRRPRPSYRRSPAEMRAARKAMRKAARQDTPVALRLFSFVRLAIVLAALTAALTLSIWFATVYVVGLFTRAIQQG